MGKEEGWSGLEVGRIIECGIHDLTLSAQFWSTPNTLNGNADTDARADFPTVSESHLQIQL